MGVTLSEALPTYFIIDTSMISTEERFGPRWYVAFTRPRTEQKVAAKITEMGIESFLPMYQVIRQWSDRKKRIRVPLFPNYVFIKTNEETRGVLFSIKDIVRFVSIEKKPVVVREQEIRDIKFILNGDFELDAEDYFQAGMKVKINRGHLSGMEGIILRKNSKARLLIKIDLLQRAFSVNIPSCFADTIA